MKKILPINVGILKKCREQMGLSYPEVQKKVKAIIEIENAQKEPTPIQLTKLAELYQVPRWVFIEKTLPTEYQYEKKSAFRKFKRSMSFNDFKLRRLVSKVEQYRRLFLELRKDIDEPIQPFVTSSDSAEKTARKVRSLREGIDEPIQPFVTPPDSAEKTARKVRKWLNLKEPLDFNSFRKKIEEQNIFIFMTSKYRHWTQMDKEAFRGISIFYDILPIIIINDSDYKKARSFTLFHELGHLLKKDMAISCETINNKEEKWCDELAGCILMPSIPEFDKSSFKRLSDLKKIAGKFKVSPYACLVRLKQLKLIDQNKYQSFEKQLKEEYERLKIKLKKSDSLIPRNRSKEIQDQFGNTFIRTVIQVLNNRELTLYKASKILDIKQPSQVLK